MTDYLERLSNAFSYAGRACVECTKVTKKLAKVLNHEHARRTKMYYRRYYRHGVT